MRATTISRARDVTNASVMRLNARVAVVDLIAVVLFTVTCFGDSAPTAAARRRAAQRSEPEQRQVNHPYGPHRRPSLPPITEEYVRLARRPVRGTSREVHEPAVDRTRRRTQRLIEAWRRDCDEVRPRTSFRRIPPAWLACIAPYGNPWHTSVVSEKRKAVMSWSSGKDSTYALHLARSSREIEIVALLTTVSGIADRVAMHGVRRELLRRQAASLGLPLMVVDLPEPCSNEIYDARMRAVIEEARALGVEVMVFGDLFLEDIRAYRESRLAGTGIEAVFPLWGRDTRALAEEMWSAGVIATLSCVDSQKVPAELVGRRWEPSLLRELPDDVDPCGELGEFHTFVHRGPGFSVPVEACLGEVVTRDPFVFVDLVPT
jgi:uncharacterized protein (TIGR00290 family)